VLIILKREAKTNPSLKSRESYQKEWILKMINIRLLLLVIEVRKGRRILKMLFRVNKTQLRRWNNRLARIRIMSLREEVLRPKKVMRRKIKP
jgi:hypothetical protein